MEDKKCEAINLEEVFEALEEIATQLEDGQVGLEASFSLYNQGIHLIKQSNEMIDKIEKQIIVLDENGSDGDEL